MFKLMHISSSQLRWEYLVFVRQVPLMLEVADIRVRVASVREVALYRSVVTNLSSASTSVVASLIVACSCLAHHVELSSSSKGAFRSSHGVAPESGNWSARRPLCTWNVRQRRGTMSRDQTTFTGQQSVTRFCKVLQTTFRPFTRACSSVTSPNTTECLEACSLGGCVVWLRLSSGVSMLFRYCLWTSKLLRSHGGHGDSSTKSPPADFDDCFDVTSLEIAAAHRDVSLLLCMRLWTEKRTYVSQTSSMNSRCSLDCVVVSWPGAVDMNVFRWWKKDQMTGHPMRKIRSGFLRYCGCWAA